MAERNQSKLSAYGLGLKVLRPLALSTMLVMGSAMAEPLQLVSVESKALSDGTELIFKLNQNLNAAPRPTESNNELSFVLPNTRLNTQSQFLLNTGVISQVKLSTDKQDLKAAIGLKTPVTYSLTALGPQLVVDIHNAAASTMAEVSHLGFTAQQNQATLSLTTSGAINPSVSSSAKSVMIVLPNTRLDSQWVSDMNVSEFNSFVTMIHAHNNGDTAVINLEVTQPVAVNYTQAAGKLIFSLQPNATANKSGDYSGKLISLDFQNIAVRSVIQIIANFTGLNMITSNSVQGTLAIHLQNVPWDQALDTILRSQGLVQKRMGNIIYIAPANEVATQDKAIAMAMAQTEATEPLTQGYYRLNYADAKQLAAMLKSNAQTWLGPRGSVSYDERTNTLMVLDTATQLSTIQALIQHVDIPVSQIQIESRIVVANQKAYQELGISGTMNALNINTPIDPAGTPVSGMNSAGFINIVSNDLNLNLQLQALETEGDSKTISSPNVTVSDKQEAYIQQGVEIPYNESTSSGAAAIAFRKAVLSLKVVPQVTPDGHISLQIRVTNDTVGKAVIVGSEEPTINTSAIDTHVVVVNGQTVVLGGIQIVIHDHQVRGIPGLADIPYLGALFRDTQDTNETRQLLIFITPKVVLPSDKQSLSMSS